MPSPFPGMDPYLENVEIWSGFHAPLMVAMLDQLSPLLRPKYFVRVEERVYLSDELDPGRRVVPDVRVIAVPATVGARSHRVGDGGAATTLAEPIPVVEELELEVHEYRLEIRDRVDRSVVTVIEVLSPTNKTPGSRGRNSFLQKRREVYATDAHWMEIDLLRGGVRTANHAPAADTPYQVYLSRSRGDGRRSGWMWPVPLTDLLPSVRVPLRGADPDVVLDLQAAFEHVYDRGAYDVDLADDYSADPPLPAMPADQLAWCRDRIAVWRAAGR